MINLEGIIAKTQGQNQEAPQEQEPLKEETFYTLENETKETIRDLKEEIKADLLKGELPQGILLKALKIICLYDTDTAYYEDMENITKAVYGVLTLEETPESLHAYKQFMYGNIKDQNEIEDAYNLLKRHRQPQKVREALKLAEKMQKKELAEIESKYGFSSDAPQGA